MALKTAAHRYTQYLAMFVVGLPAQASQNVGAFEPESD